ncbi:MAG: DUF4011 domain-containing protein [Pelagibacterales bacterium]|nr:DUF4011 domain-containing protein [Pelagibacterales bacterium]
MENRLNKRIELWKKNLLDLSRRNPLIAFKSPKRTSIRVVDELPTEVFQQLIIEEQKFEFLPKEEANLNGTNLVSQNPGSEDVISENTIENVDHDESEFFKYTRHDLEDKHTDNFLQTQLSDSDLF